MRKRNLEKYLILFCSICFMACLSAGCSTKDYDKMTIYDKARQGYSLNILINGDSIGEGNSDTAWGTIVANDLKELYKLPSVQVSNISLGGNTSYAGYSRLNCTDSESGYDLVFICYGQNDADDSDFPIMYESMLRATIKKYPKAQVVAILESSQKEYTNKINQIIEICEYYKIPYVDTIAAFEESGYSYEKLTDDGVHPNEQGRQVYADAIFSVIQEQVLDKSHKTELPANYLNEKCEDYEYFCYIPVSEMEKNDNNYQIVVSDDFKTIGIDRVLMPGSYYTELVLDDEHYDLGYSWDYDFGQRHMTQIESGDYKAQTLSITADQSALSAMNGIILTSDKPFTQESFTEDTQAVEMRENSIKAEKSISRATLGADGMVQVAADDADNNRNYMIYVYKVEPESYLEISSTAIGNANTITRYAFFEDENGEKLVKAGARNSDGWNDSYTAKVQVPQSANYLFVTTQNGSVASVIKNENQAIYEQINYERVLNQKVIDNSGNIVGLESSENNKNYSVYVYDIGEETSVKIKTDASGNANTLMRYGFSNSMDDSSVARKGSLNTNGWEDELVSKVKMTGEERYLFVTCQNGMIPSVVLINDKE